MPLRFSFSRLLLVGSMGLFAGCFTIDRPTTVANSVDRFAPGTTLLANTGYDVKTFYFLDGKSGRYSDYFGTLGKFTYNYEKTGPTTGKISTTWKSDVGATGTSDAELSFSSATQGHFTAQEISNDDTRTVKGRFTIKPPGAPVEAPAITPPSKPSTPAPDVATPLPVAPAAPAATPAPTPAPAVEKPAQPAAQKPIETNAQPAAPTINSPSLLAPLPPGI
jgi:hypothetical protein